MPESGLEYRVKNVVSAVLNVPFSSISISSSNKNVKNWDSLNIINLMIALESEFGITLEVDEAAELISVEKIMSVLKTKGLS